MVIEAEHCQWGPCALTSDAQVSTIMMLFNSMKPDDIQVYPSQWRVHSNLKETQSDLEQSLSQCVAEATVLVWSRDPPLFMA